MDEPWCHTLAVHLGRFAVDEEKELRQGRRYAVTRRLAERMGGSAGVSSMPGVGSTFWFTVRLKKRAAEPAPVMTAPVDARAVLQSRYAGLRVLLVEDEPINCELGKIFLEEVNLVVDVAEDGLQAVAMASSQVYALILMDMRMPHMDGLDATREIRKMPHCKDIPIIAMTANAFVEDKVQCIDAGMNDFLTKPTPENELYAAIYRNLSQTEPGSRLP